MAASDGFAVLLPAGRHQPARTRSRVAMSVSISMVVSTMVTIFLPKAISSPQMSAVRCSRRSRDRPNGGREASGRPRPFWRSRPKARRSPGGTSGALCRSRSAEMKAKHGEKRAGSGASPTSGGNQFIEEFLEFIQSLSSIRAYIPCKYVGLYAGVGVRGCAGSLKTRPGGLVSKVPKGQAGFRLENALAGRL